MKNKNCILCGNGKVKNIINLGKTPLANNLTKNKNTNFGGNYPLILGICRNCNHIQLGYLPKKNLMFDNYLYLSSASKTLLNHLKKIPKVINNTLKLKKGDIVMDIGSNDGSLLSGYNKNVIKIAVEPAKNLKSYYANKNNTKLYNSYFTSDVSKKIKNKYNSLKVITATNVFPHIQDLKNFAKNIKNILDKNGVFVLEGHYFYNLFKDVAFDTIYHEHCSFWTASSIKLFCDTNNLELIDVERLSLHHGQIRCWISHKNRFKVSKRCLELLKFEKSNNLNSLKTLLVLKNKVLKIKKKINYFFNLARRKNKNVVGYGAPAKATTITSFLKLNSSKIKYIVDKNHLKHGKFIPGTDIKIYPVSEMKNMKIDYLFNFAWNFNDEIYKQNKGLFKNGTKMICPIPKFKIH